MAFDPSSFQSSEPRFYPVILLLDVSGSMSGEPIAALHAAVTEMTNSFAEQRSREKMIKVAVITFGGSGAKLHTSYTDAPDLQSRGIPHFNANGGTPLGEALRMAKEMLEDRATTPGRWYRPSVVLVSDGYPNDGWEGPLRSFINEGRTAKCLRIAVPIGTDAYENMMQQFTGDRAQIFYAQDVASIADAFKNVVMSVTQSQKASKPIDAAPTQVRTTGTTVKRVARHTDEEDE